MHPRGPCGPRLPLFCAHRPSPLRFYPHGPCGPRRGLPICPPRSVRFYPRGPCGPRHDAQCSAGDGAWFLSARPVRAATIDLACGRRDFGVVSIRAARAGRDSWYRRKCTVGDGFLSARSVRAATSTNTTTVPASLFLSARPVRAATISLDQTSRGFIVSIRAARAGRDNSSGIEKVWLPVSIRAARAGRDVRSIQAWGSDRSVSIRAARAGRDELTPSNDPDGEVFLSARPVRAATARRQP